MSAADLDLTVETVDDCTLWDQTVLPLGAHPLQLWGWGQVKSAGSWTAHRVLVKDKAGQVAGGAQVLARAMPWPLQRLSYIPRGPVVAAGYDRAQITDQVVAWVRAQVGGIGVTLEPQWDRDCGIQIAGARPAVERILVPDTLIIDLTQTPEALQAAMRRSARQRLRKGLKGPLELREVVDAELDQVMGVYHQVAERAGFALHPDSYYSRVRQELGAAHSPIFGAFEDGALVAFIWLAASDKTSFELYAGSTERGQRLDANYALKWTAWMAMKERGLTEYDLNGLLNDGISEFKRAFAQHENPLFRAVDVPFGPSYSFWQTGAPTAKRVFRALRRN